jgi:type I restriction enzyme M protein
MKTPTEPKQPDLFDAAPPENLFSAFKQTYFHLYTNSSSSRAENIFEDLARILLLISLVQEDATKSDEVAAALDGQTPETELARILGFRFPDYLATEDEFSLDPEDIRRAYNILSRFPIAETPGQMLSDAFQAIIGPRLRGEKGQFFTPVSVVKSMVEIANPGAGSTIIDPAAGTGNFLIEVFNYIRRDKSGKDTRLIGIEKERDLQRIGGAFCHLITHGHAKIICRNSLTLLHTDPPELLGSADFVLTNPPFGTNIKVKDRAILSTFDLGHAWHYSKHHERCFRQDQIAAGQDPQILFIELCIRLLKPDGLLGIILPEGIFGNRGSQFVWDFIRERCSIEYLVDCPRTTFQPGTDTKTNIAFLSLRKTPKHGGPFVAVPQHCGHDRRGRTQTNDGSPFPNDFLRLGQDLREERRHWKKVKLSQPDYLVPRFYFNEALVNASPNEWPFEVKTTLTFKDLIQDGVLTIRKGHEVGSESYGTGDIPFIRTSDIHNWEVTSVPTNSVSEDVYEKYRHLQNLQPNDILLVVDGRYRIGRAAILHETNVRCVVQSHLRILTLTRNDLLDPFDLLFALGLPVVTQQIRNLTFVQSTLASVGKRLERLMIPVFEQSGNYMKTVDAFRSALVNRAELLAELNSFDHSEAEL